MDKRRKKISVHRGFNEYRKKINQVLSVLISLVLLCDNVSQIQIESCYSYQRYIVNSGIVLK